MRVFIGLVLEDSIKTLLESLQNAFRVYAQRGNFTHHANFHLTLVFIGEVSDAEIDVLRECVDELSFEAFQLSLDSLGCFKRKEGDIWWVGLHQSQALNALRDQIVKNLHKRNIPFDQGAFVPHLTLVRNYRSLPNHTMTLPNVTPTLITINRVSLFQSHRVNGELRYTELHYQEY